MHRRALVVVAVVAVAGAVAGCPRTPLGGKDASEPLNALFALEADAIMDDGSGRVPDGLHAALLWRGHCNSCRLSGVPEPDFYDENGDFSVEKYDEWQRRGAQVWLQPVRIVGDFPKAFTIGFEEEPPAEAVEVSGGYPTGMLVLSTSDEPMVLQRDVAVDGIGFGYPFLFPDEAAALGVVTMPPLYVSYVTDIPLLVRDSFQIEGESGEVPDGTERPLEYGFHVSRHNGVAINAEVRRFACSYDLPSAAQAQVDECYATIEDFDQRNACVDAIVTEHCGTIPQSFETIDVLEDGAEVSVNIGGAEDLLNAFAEITAEDLLN